MTPRSRAAAVALLLLGALASVAPAADPRRAFFDTLRRLDGARYEGVMTFPREGRNDFAGKTLVAHVARATSREIRVPFLVGDDRSRTWVFTRSGQTLRLQHDHRHADGSPDSITLYGGRGEHRGDPPAAVLLRRLAHGQPDPRRPDQRVDDPVE